MAFFIPIDRCVSCKLFAYLAIKQRRAGTTEWPTLSLSVLSIPLLNNEAFAYLIIISCYNYIINPFLMCDGSSSDCVLKSPWLIMLLVNISWPAKFITRS